MHSNVDVALVDTFGGAKHGPTSIQALAADTAAKVLVFAWSRSSRSVERALRDGACGYVTKSASCETLVVAIEAAASPSHVPVPWVVQEAPGSKPGGAWPGKHAGLSRREAEILSLIVQGLRNQEIAERACLSINSIKSHIRTAYRKIHALDRAQAVIWGMKTEIEHFRTPRAPLHPAPLQRATPPMADRLAHACCPARLSPPHRTTDRAGGGRGRSASHASHPPSRRSECPHLAAIRAHVPRSERRRRWGAPRDEPSA